MDKVELLEKAVKKQHDKLKFLNKVMFETTSHQLNLSEEEQNLELLHLSWGTNDIISDDPEMHEIIKELKEEYDLTI